MNAAFSQVCLLALISGCGDGSHASLVPVDDARLCSLRGCGLVAELGVPFAGNEADLAGGTGRLCHNDLCGEVTIARAPGAGGTGDKFIVDDLFGWVLIFRTDGELSVRGWVEQYDRTFAAGDIFTLTYTAQDGRVLVDGRWMAREYAVSYPNGVACGPECFAAQLEMVPLLR